MEVWGNNSRAVQLGVALVTVLSGGVSHAELALEEVTVTAARTSDSVGVGALGERPILDTPLSATGYTAVMILDQGARSTAEVLANDPSIRVQGAGDGNYDYFSIRGFSVSASAFSLNGLYGVLPWNTFSPETLEQFEVVRGPSTTFTGASPFDNPGGAVNIQPKRAGDTPLTRMTALFDTAGQAGAHADVGRRFGADNTWGVRINAAYRDGEVARDHQSEKVQLFSLGTDYRGESMRLSLDAGYQEFRTDGATFLYHIDAGTAIPAAPETDDNTSPEWMNADSRDVYAAVRGEFDLGEQVMLYAALGTRDHQSSIVNPYPQIQDQDGNLHLYSYQEAYFAKTKWSGEAGMRTNVETGSVHHQVIVSASGIQFDTGWLGTYSDGFAPLPDFSSNLYAPVFPLAPDLSGTASDGQLQLSNKLTGVALIDTLSIDDGRYQLTLGLRRQSYDIERLYETEPQARFYNKSAWSPSVAVLMKVTEATSVYANYITGLSQGPFAPIGTENANEAFPPSKSKQFELGAKAKWGDFFTSIALFQITQPAALTDPDTNIFSVNGEQRHRGVEWTFAGEVGGGLRVLGGMNYIDAKLTHTAGSELDGKRAPGVPELTANVGGEWDVSWLRGFTLTGRLIYTDEQFVYDDNVQSIPAWTRVDMGARYATEMGKMPLTLRLNVINVTGKDYWASAKGFGLTLGSPRSVLLSGTMDF